MNKQLFRLNILLISIFFSLTLGRSLQAMHTTSTVNISDKCKYISDVADELDEHVNDAARVYLLAFHYDGIIRAIKVIVQNVQWHRADLIANPNSEFNSLLFDGLQGITKITAHIQNFQKINACTVFCLNIYWEQWTNYYNARKEESDDTIFEDGEEDGYGYGDEAAYDSMGNFLNDSIAQTLKNEIAVVEQFVKPPQKDSEKDKNKEEKKEANASQV